MAKLISAWVLVLLACCCVAGYWFSKSDAGWLFGWWLFAAGFFVAGMVLLYEAVELKLTVEAKRDKEATGEKL